MCEPSCVNVATNRQPGALESARALAALSRSVLLHRRLSWFLVHPIHILGGGLAGSEAALQIAGAGLPCVLHEMRPTQATAAHKTPHLAELVCSNSLKSESENSAPWLLKEELRRLGSFLLRIASDTRVPGGHALTVDRELFAEQTTKAIENNHLIEIRRNEVASFFHGKINIIATGPLTTPTLAAEIARITGSDRLFFYDSISPIVDATTINLSIAFRASRYNRSLDSGDDYLNCPFDREQYEHFVDAVLAADAVPAHIPEDQTAYFEACLPIEELARRGRDTLRFGPMKPVGLTDPRTGRRPYAVVQLRQENLRAESYNLVGFQNHMRFAEQACVFRMIPGLEEAEFLRFGSVHRNTFVNAPELLSPEMELVARPGVYLAGQVSGVEGYVESAAGGFLCAQMLADRLVGRAPRRPPETTALGGILTHLSRKQPRYQPSNITWAHLPPLEGGGRRLKKRDRYEAMAERALADLATWLREA